MSDEPLIGILGSLLAEAEFAYLYGSAAESASRLRSDSDVDLAVWFAAPLSVDERIDWTARLAEATGRDVDLIDLWTADPIISMQVLRHGRLIHCQDRAALSAFQIRAPQVYYDFKIERRQAEQALVESLST